MWDEWQRALPVVLLSGHLMVGLSYCGMICSLPGFAQATRIPGLAQLLNLLAVALSVCAVQHFLAAGLLLCGGPAEHTLVHGVALCAISLPYAMSLWATALAASYTVGYVWRFRPQPVVVRGA